MKSNLRELPSMTGIGSRDAISVRNACKTYGTGEKGTQVLKDLSLTVKEGTIYTLLGSSGCGKTTLLSSIVGMIELDRGDCKIFGLQPGSTGCGIPGKKVGYMPQETALYGEFTIREAMLYFGKINGMTTEQIEDRTAFLIKFLHLPPSHRVIRSLSGGQQRRVSFAVALLHEPKILILDEPTVGVDPLLRKSIWKHLSDLVNTGKTTVVITTHYIEEATEAHRIGLMRNGRLLAEDSPENLLESFGCTKLEDVFFKLCERDSHDLSPSDFGSVRSSSGATLRSQRTDISDAETGSTTTETLEPSSLDTTVTAESDIVTTSCFCDETKKVADIDALDESSQTICGSVPPLIIPGEEFQKSSNFEELSQTKPEITIPPPLSSNDATGGGALFQRRRKCLKLMEAMWAIDPIACANRMNALLLKNFICMWRNIGFVFFIFCLPALQAVLFCVAIGGDPSELPLGVVNHEVAAEEYNRSCQISPGSCVLANMSCGFLDKIPRSSLTLIPFESEAEALAQAKLGNVWGYMVLPSNFTDAILQKGLSGEGGPRVPDESFQGTQMKLNLDMTSQQIAFAIQRTLALSFQKFATNLIEECGMNDTIEFPSSSFAEPIYGTTDVSFREFMAPGIILSIIFFMSVALTGSAFVMEKKEGMLNRTLVSGVTTGEIITAHMITQYFVMAGQTILVLAVMIWVFEVNIAGSTLLVVFLTLVQGTCGMAYGFLISCVCNDERNAIQMALGSFYPNLLLSGVVWPLESMPMYIRQVATFLPQTMASEAMRSIFSRGWGITHPKVWPGFVASIGWSVVFWICALLLAQMKGIRRR